MRVPRVADQKAGYLFKGRSGDTQGQFRRMLQGAGLCSARALIQLS